MFTSSRKLLNQNREQILRSQRDAILQDYQRRLSRNRNVTEVNFNDGSKYVGEIEMGAKSGLGILFAPDGSLYLGDWLEDTYNGEGVYIHADGERYEGELDRGEKAGLGKMHYLNGDFYEGEWEMNMKEGNGEQIYSNGERYVGEWKNGERSGEGVLYSNGEAVAQGVWNEDRFLSGKVKTKYYQGGWGNNAFNGQGLYRFADGSYYQGEWKNNEKNGSGIYSYSNGDSYEGEFMSGLKHGKGVYKYASGDIYEGNYQYDLKHGFGCLRFHNGDTYSGSWERDQFSGKGKYQFNQREFLNGQFKQGRFVSHLEMIREDKGQSVRNEGSNGNWGKVSEVSSPVRLVQVDQSTKVGESPQPNKSKTLGARTSRRRLQY